MNKENVQDILKYIGQEKILYSKPTEHLLMSGMSQGEQWQDIYFCVLKSSPKTLFLLFQESLFGPQVDDFLTKWESGAYKKWTYNLEYEKMGKNSILIKYL